MSDCRGAASRRSVAPTLAGPGTGCAMGTLAVRGRRDWTDWRDAAGSAKRDTAVAWRSQSRDARGLPFPRRRAFLYSRCAEIAAPCLPTRERGWPARPAAAQGPAGARGRREGGEGAAARAEAAALGGPHETRTSPTPDHHNEDEDQP